MASLELLQTTSCLGADLTNPLAQPEGISLSLSQSGEVKVGCRFAFKELPNKGIKCLAIAAQKPEVAQALMEGAHITSEALTQALAGYEVPPCFHKNPK